MGRWVAAVPNQDPDRLRRVLDERLRTIGVDKSFLDQQVLEHQAQRHALHVKDRSEDEREQSLAAARQQAAEDALCARKKVRQDLRAYRASQHKEDAREYDLHRKDALKLDQPARVGDADSRCTASSLQQFVGEDLTMAARCDAQKRDNRSAWDQQSSKTQEKRWATQAEMLEHANLIKELDRVQNVAAQGEKAAKQNCNQATMVRNKELAAQVQQISGALREANFNDDQVELHMAATCPYLNEDPATAASALGPHRVKTDSWKGMSEEQRQQIRVHQLAQAADKVGMTHNEALKARHMDDVNMQRVLMVIKNEQAAKAEARQTAYKVATTQQDQMHDKRTRDWRLTQLYTNPPQPAYFAQFETSHR